MPIQQIIKVIKSESTPGVLLIIAGVLAMIVSNSPLHVWYEHLLETHVSIKVGEVGFNKPILLWINDGLMAVFFLHIGLEVKREILEGNLSSIGKVVLPCIGAFGGVVCPAAIYFFLNHDNPAAINGWAIPTATDIAFAIGILVLLGSRVPVALKVLLTTIAIFDDLLAIAIIAIFYSHGLSYISFLFVAIFTAILYTMNYCKVKTLSPYVLIGILLWVSVVKSGVHATLTGVVLAGAIPLKINVPKEQQPLHRLENALYPWVVFFILPIFAFANAGIRLEGFTMAEIWHPVPFGITLGLFIGKQLGVFSISWLGIKLQIAELPKGVTWRHLYGMSILCGIGFTMSLFISSLAFEPTVSEYGMVSRLGILCGSTLSAVIGFVFLRFSLKEAKA